MPATPAAASQPQTLGRDSPAPAASAGWARWSVGLGVLLFVSGAFLVVMYVSLALGGGAAPWGPINDALAAGGNVILAALVPYLSNAAARTPTARWFVRTVVAASLAASAAGLLLVTRLLSFETSTTVSILGIVVQCLWLIWLNRVWARHDAMPLRITRFGWAIGAGLLTGMALVAGSLLLPWGSAVANVLLFPGVVLGGVLWLAWPLYFILLGRHLNPGGRRLQSRRGPDPHLT